MSAVALGLDHVRTPRGPRPESASPSTKRRAGRSRVLEIGVVNNMPDSALRATERHFAGLLATAGPRPVRLRFFTLPEIVRHGSSAAHVAAHYRDIATLDETPLDGLIMTGTEPRGALTDEPYWPRLTALIDWAEHNTISTMFSCLAAHAVALHLDGIERRPLPTKLSGVFGFTQCGQSPLLADMPPIVTSPHSRWNEVAARDLVASGYHVLTASPAAGADIFVKPMRSLFVCLQGHPEYESDTLLREYRRDIRRFLRGETACCPAPPAGYFDAATEAELADIKVGGSDDAAIETALAALHSKSTDTPWRSGAVTFMRNWLSYIAARKP